MLVLSRKLGEEILIAGTVTVKVLEIRKGQIKLGVSAPDNIPIFRKELVDGPGQDSSNDSSKG